MRSLVTVALACSIYGNIRGFRRTRLTYQQSKSLVSKFDGVTATLSSPGAFNSIEYAMNLKVQTMIPY